MTAPPKQVWLYGTAIPALMIIGYFVAYAPAARRLESVRYEVTDAQRKLDDYRLTMAELPAFLEADRNLESMRRQLNSSLFAKGDILELFRQLTREAENHSLQLVQITPPIDELLELNRQASPGNIPLYLSVTLDFKGQYADFGRYVSRLEAMPYFRSVKACYLRGRQTVQPVIDMSLSFKALIGTTEEAS